MGYENAPATELVATSCCCCARPLVDADSVRTGIGPVCAKRHGFTKPSLFPKWDDVRRALGDEEYAEHQIDAMRPLYDDNKIARMVANRLVYRLAADIDGARTPARTVALAALGYDGLAEKIAERVGAIRIEEEGDQLVVRTPKSERFIQEMRRVSGARWVWERRARLVPVASKRGLWSAIKAAFPGSIVVGSKGMAVAS